MPAAPLTDKVYALLQKWRSEPVLPPVFADVTATDAQGGAARSVPGVERGGWSGDSTPLVAVAQVCRDEATRAHSICSIPLTFQSFFLRFFYSF